MVKRIVLLFCLAVLVVISGCSAIDSHDNPGHANTGGRPGCH